MRTVKPVEGFFLHDVPAVEQEVSDTEARHLVATGAFEYKGQAHHEPAKQPESGPDHAGKPAEES